MITADWYFTRCLETEKEPDRAAALLGILECVDHGDRDPLTQRLAVEELMRLDSWMQTYALPRVLTLADRAMPAVYAVCDRYFESLVSEVSEHEPLLDLLHAAISDDSRELLRAFGAAMQRQSHASHQPTDRPYLDARDFLPENAILAALARAVERNGRLAEDLRGDDALLRPLVQRALDGELGRLAFVLGVRLSFVCGYDSLEDLGRRVRKHPGFLLQPDLVELWIWLHFIGSGATSAAALLQESIELAHFHRFPAAVAVPERGKPPYVHPLPGLPLGHYRAAEVILWQFTLWNAAAALEAQATATFLGRFWLLPRALPRRVVMSHPGPQPRAEAWRKTLQDVSNLRRERVALTVEEGKEAWPGDAAWLAASPFIEMDRRRSPITPGWVALLRLLLGTSLAAQLLPRIENDDFRPFAALLVQAHDALAAFALPSQKAGAKRYTIAPVLSVLALFAQQQMKEAASCNDPAVSPETFLALFETGASPTDEEVTFCGNVLPSVLMSFVADCFASAIRGNGEARWLDSIAMIAPALAEQDDDHRRESEQVIRFLSGDDGLPLTDWKQGVAGRWSAVHERELLVDADPRPVDWYRPDWNEPADTPTASYRQLRLTRVVQRFVASFREPGGVPAEVLAEWRGQLVDELAVLNHESEFDPFLLLRLIEIVSDQTLELTLDERRTIAGVILEFGSSFHVQRLLDQLFPMADPRATDVRLRADVLPVIAREAYAADLPEGAAVRDPRDMRRRLERRRVLRDALGRISALAATDPAYDEVVQRLAQLRFESDRALTSDLQRATLEYDGVAASEWQMPRARPPAAREILSIARDPNRMTITVLFGDYQTGSAVSLFDVGPDEREKLLTRERLELFAFVVAVAQEGPSFAMTLNCGLGTYVKWRGKTRPRFAEGARVAVMVKRNGTVWEPAEEPILLTRKRAVCFAVAQLELDLMHKPNRIALRIEGRAVPNEAENRGPDGFFDRRYWVPLIRDSFRFDRKYEIRTVAEHLDTGEWRPIAHELWQLAAGARGRPGVALTIVEVRQNEELLIVCSAPGSLYRLRLQDLGERDRERVKAMIEEESDARGVQLLGTIALDDRRLQIRLADDPFDFRDARWRAQFSGVDNCLAERRGSQYLCAATEPLKDYPEWIAVTMIPPPPDLDEVDFSPTGRWDPWRVSVTGTPILFNELSIPEEERPAFVDDWAQLSVGKRFTIRRPIAPVSPYGDLLCTTTDGITVSVPAESLTMGSLQQRIRSGDLNRQAEVTRIQNQAPVTFDLDESVLPEQVRFSPRSVGIIARAPRLKDAKPNTRVPLWVWWQCGSSVVAADMELPVESARKLHLGSLVEAKPSGDPHQWKVSVTPRSIRARALWRLEGEEQSAPKDSLYLGVMSVGRKQQAVVERVPGVLVPLLFTPNARHAAAYDGTRYVGGFSPQDWVRVDSPSGGRAARLQVVVPTQTADRNIVWGDASREHRGEASVTPQLRMLQRPDCWFVLERYFRVTPKAVVVPPPPPGADRGEDLNARDRETLERYFTLPDQTLKVTVVSPQLVRLRAMRVPQHGHPERWTSDVPVHPDHGPYLQGIDYNRDTARVRLFRDENERVFASFRLVLPFDVAAYIEAQFGDDDAEDEPLRARLYYAGKEGTQHRFEWEYGWSLLADEADLRVDKKKFSRVEALLFIGDAVTHASVLREKERKILSFDSLTIRYSESSHIYFQRKKQVVHLLKLTADAEMTLKINTVIGMAEHSTADSHPFTRSRATLTPAAQQIVRERFAERGESAAEGLTIFGRFNDETYRQSLGRISSFDHVMATIDPVTGLRGEELVFLTATRFRDDLINDCGIIVSPVGLEPKDIGPDMRKLTILRRHFSVREEVLSRIAETDPAMIEGRMYLVRLRTETQGAGASRIFGSLWRNMPARSSAALKTLLTSGFVLATVVNDQGNKSRAIDVEWSPGIFLRVPYNELELDDPELDGELPRGTVVRLEARDGRIRITRGAFAETRYIPETGLRTVVVLPKNELADKRRDEYQQGNASWNNLKFPIGGLPNVLAIPGQYDAQTGRWHAPSATKFRTLMQQQHPKLALAGVDHNGDVRITPGVRDELAGSIAWDEATRQARFVPHPSTEGVELPLEWSSLSFADVSVQDLAQRMKNTKWRYHDTVTSVWTGRDGARDQKLRNHDGTTGPLFFDEIDEELTLRFSPEAIQSFGFSARELVASLERGGTEYVVALATSSGLWVEITPGRVAEVPYSQMVTATPRGLVPLEKLHWDAFAPGDRIRLRLASADPKVADKVVLVDWWPGLRGSFPQAAVLPVVRHDLERGEIELGAGEFRMLYPRIAPEPRRVVRLSPVNRFTSAHPDNLRIGDSALLVIEDGVLRIAGLAGTAVPSGNGWEGDPFADIFAGPWRGMKDLVAAAGGALPVTIEGIRGEQVYFSRHHQAAGSVIPPGKFARCRVLGLVDADSMLLRHGSGLITASPHFVISGLPRSLFFAAAALLNQAEMPVWIRRPEDGGEYEFGLAEDGYSVDAEVIDVLSNRTAAGLVCRSRATGMLYWLPIEWCAWTRLTPDEARAIFVRNPERKSITAAVARDRLNNRVLTITGTAEALAELRTLDVDQEIAVRIVAPRAAAGTTAAPSHYLVETRSSSRMLLDCRIDDPPDEGKKDIRVEIIRRVMGRLTFVLSTPVNTRRYSVDLPTWMMTDDMNGAAPRLVVKAQGRWLAAPRLLVSPTDDQLDQALCQLWAALAENVPVDAEQAGIIVDRWAARSLRRDEIELAHALICVLSMWQLLPERRKLVPRDVDPEIVRDFVQEWSQRASSLLRHLGQRAVRSLHVEVLSSLWIKRDVLDPPRLGQLRKLLRGSMTAADLALVRQFCRYADLGGAMVLGKELQLLSDGLRRAIGEPEIRDTFHQGASLLNRVARLAETIPDMPNVRLALDRAHVTAVREILDAITGRKLDITLLAPIPLVHRAEGEG